MRIPGGDAIVIGAGLIGLAVAFELAQRGAVVRVYDRSEPARAASWAGAGMLAPYTESLVDEALLALCALSLDEYPAFVRRIHDASGVDPKLRLDGILDIAYDDARYDELAAHTRDLARRGIPCQLLDRSQTLGAEASLGAAVRGALLIANEGSVDNRRLGRGLAAACAARGVTIVQSSSVCVECDDRRVLGVQTDLGFSPAETVVNACGAWAGELPGLPASCTPPIVPIKGQMLALAVPKGFVRRVVWVPGAYLVPRDDGRLLIGATTERTGFDTRATAEGVHTLLHAALQAVPALRDFTISETWAGLRPASPDGRPFLGPTPISGLWLATGHYRNGILLAPATARMIADGIEGRAGHELEPFGLARLETEASRGRTGEA